MSKYALAYDLANKFNFSNGQPEWDVTSFTSEYTTRTLIGLDKYEEACEYINSNSSIGPKIKEVCPVGTPSECNERMIL